MSFTESSTVERMILDAVSSLESRSVAEPDRVREDPPRG
jgi:hypothetical protein